MGEKQNKSFDAADRKKDHLKGGLFYIAELW